MTDTDNEKKQKDELVDTAGLFRNESKSGVVYYAGKVADGITLKPGDKLVMFRNKYYDPNGNRPYFNLKVKVDSMPDMDD